MNTAIKVLISVLWLVFGSIHSAGQSVHSWNFQCARSINHVAYSKMTSNVYTARKGIELNAICEKQLQSAFQLNTGFNLACSLFERIESYSVDDSVFVFTDYTTAYFSCNIPIAIGYSFNNVVSASIGGFIGYNFYASQSGYEGISVSTAPSIGKEFSRRDPSLNPVGVGLTSSLKLRMNERWHLAITYRHYLSNYYKTVTSMDSAQMRVTSFAIGRSF
ncbi:MAG: outer membrane beta-barrel protein [Flavobacteriales bacterium]